MKEVDFSETIAACDLKLIDLIRYLSIEGQGHCLTLAQCRLYMKINLLFSVTTWSFSTNVSL